jgi:ligand-binding sensor domain-containing protein
MGRTAIKTPVMTLLALVCWVSLPESRTAQAQPKDSDRYLQTIWTTEDGLPQNSITTLAQTRDGYLWRRRIESFQRWAIHSHQYEEWLV